MCVIMKIINNSFSTYSSAIGPLQCTCMHVDTVLVFMATLSCLSSCVCLQVCLSADVRFIQVVEGIN